jgi:hypothetical protein
VRDDHPFVDRRERRSHPLQRLLLIAVAALAVSLLFVWIAGEITGALWHGTWPPVPLAQSGGELIQLCQHPADAVAAGIPGGTAYFSILTLLVVATGTLAVWTWRLLYRPRVYWAPPRLLGRRAHQPFLRGYRQGRARRWG